MIQDWNSWEKGKWGNKHLDPARFGHMKEIHEKLHAMDVHTLISVWPNMAKDCEDYRQMQEAGHILPDRSTYDAFSEEARALYWKQAKEGLWDQGFDGWWCDSTEPFTGQDWNGPTLREPWERYSRVGGEQKRYLGAERASLFALAHARGIYENQRKTTEEKRVVNLTRSGYASQQQYGAILWSGDIAASWETLRRQIVEGLHMSMSGYPYWTTDIGAFFVVGDEGWQHRGCGGHTNPKPIWFWKGDFDEGTEDPAYRELYVRWLEWGTFLPIMRSHGTDFAREIWQFGEEGTPYYDAIARFIRLRYRLLPYIYSIAAGVSLRDENMIESLISAFPQDPTVKEIMDGVHVWTRLPGLSRDRAVGTCAEGPEAGGTLAAEGLLAPGDGLAGFLERSTVYRWTMDHSGCAFGDPASSSCAVAASCRWQTMREWRT